MASNNDLGRLRALRDRLEAVLSDDATTPRDLASVSREYRLLLDHIARSAPADAGSKLDEISKQRSKRKGKTA